MKFSVIIADPPWAYESASSLAKVSCLTSKDDQEYTTTHSTNLHDLGGYLEGVTQPDSILFCWVTGPMFQQGIELMTAWGYPFSQVAFVWHKVRTNPGRYTLTSCEFVLVGRKGRIPTPYFAAGAKQFLQHDREKHSSKPEEIQSRIERMFPLSEHSFLELFARRYRDPWVCIGNAISGNDIRSDLQSLAIDATFTENRARHVPTWKRRQQNLF